MKWTTLTISITEEMYNKLEELRRKLGYANRSEFVRAIIRAWMNRNPYIEPKKKEEQITALGRDLDSIWNTVEEVKDE